MATIRGNLKLVDVKGLQNSILRILADEINTSIKKNSNKFKGAVKRSIARWLREQPEVKSLLDSGPDTLSAHFGLPDGTAAPSVNAIVDAVVNAVNIKIQNVSRTLTGGYVEFSYNGSDIYNLIGLPDGYVITEKGTSLPWLNWLLTMGDTVIVVGYEYVPSTGGRSGGGTMLGGIAWRVPPQFSGTIDDNFITRAMSGRETEMEQLLRSIIS